MSRTKGSKNKAKALTPGVNKIDDLQYEVAILKAAVKQLIRENRDWRIHYETALRTLSNRLGSDFEFRKYGIGGKLERDGNLDAKRGAESGIRAGTV